MWLNRQQTTSTQVASTINKHAIAHSTRFYNKTVPILVSVVLQEVRYITSGYLGNNEKIAFGKVPQTEKDYILQVVKSTKPKIIRISTKP
ncbi:MAG: hypothetical protein COA32_17580 [Fluviicola sp.]|nr:MAG: hypothetical protein COA32_17580 [Fluviicola sp.]